MEILNPPGWPRPRGYSNGVSAIGRIVAVSGQIGWDPATERIVSTDFAAQADRALENLVSVLAAGGATPAHVVRLTWFVTDRAAYLAARAALSSIYRKHFGTHYPAMSVIFVTSLVEEGALVEIEGTAVLPE
jgi:enamine deaminase RidA (YjgF/YER057c/UK114 family)